MKTSDFDYRLPQEAIAQTPAEPRHASRLMVLDRAGGTLQHVIFRDLVRFLRPDDLLVINRTRVIPARLIARKPTGGRVEILLLKRIGERTWEALIGGKGVRIGQRLSLADAPSATVTEELEGSRRIVQFEEALESLLPGIGQMPLPPYIHTPLTDPERYQTVYAQTSGSAAAPTAGLHFTRELISEIEGLGVRFVPLTLHIGLDTFAPVTESSPQDHQIHSEWCELSPESAEMINQTRARGGRVIAVGTTSVRTLETAAQRAQDGQSVAPFSGPTNLFILPGHVFRAVDALITNFHLPKSSLIMLVSAFAGRERILDAYQKALAEGYRFYSFGDAMLIL